MKKAFRGRLLIAAALFLFQTSFVFAASSADAKGLLPLGSPAPAFSLPDVVTGKAISLKDFSGKRALVVIFLCRHCPFVQRDKQGIVQFAKDYASKDVGIVAVSANDPSAYKEDAPASLKAMAVEDHFPMPLLFDASQNVAKAYTAVATPDIFVFDQNQKLVYRGQFDAARPGNDVPVTGKDVRTAVDDVLAGRPVTEPQKPAIGCSIKWKPGNAPAYFS